MEGKSPSAAIPYLRSCKKESVTPLEGKISGEIPQWMTGSLIRVGPGLLEIGPYRYNHVFDGLALLHKFSFQEGRVTYQNRFLKSDTYRRNMAANRIATSEFGTKSVPDPCQTIFQRFASYFQTAPMTDNDSVNLIRYTGNELYACTEANDIWKVDPDTLESLQKVKLSDYVPIHIAIAHAHEEPDGTVYNIGSVFGYNCTYNILKFPPKAQPAEDGFKAASLLCAIPSSQKLRLSYYHSFAMTENYFVIVEQPLYMRTKQLTMALMTSSTFAEILEWDKDAMCRFHVVRRSDNTPLDVRYLSGGFFVFHHINAYEEDGHLVVDMCTFRDGDVVRRLYCEALEDCFRNPKASPPPPPSGSKATRFVLPLNVANGEKDENMVKLRNTKATAKRQSDGAIFLCSETLTTTDAWSPEMPRINYERYNGRKYRYFYGIAKNEQFKTTCLVKVDTANKEVTSWHEEGVIPSEPVFVADPGAEEEDSGVVLASLLYTEDEAKVSLLVLRARDLGEVGRATFHTESSVPADFHGTFLSKV